MLDRVAEPEVPAALQAELAPLVRAMQRVNAQVAAVEQQPEPMAQDATVGQRFRTAPGVGPLPALAFVAPLDAVERFAKAPHVASSLGLVPREWSAGEPQPRGTSTQQGNGQMRALVVGAAWRIGGRQGTRGSRLRQWTERLAARRGKRVALVALARRLAGMLYALGRDGRVDDEARGGQRHRVAVTIYPRSDTSRMPDIGPPGWRRQAR